MSSEGFTDSEMRNLREAFSSHTAIKKALFRYSCDSVFRATCKRYRSCVCVCVKRAA